jgi:hypothetical protein
VIAGRGLGRYAGPLIGAVLATAATMLALPGPAGAGVTSTSSAGYGLHAAAAAGSVNVSDPTAIVPYADQVVTKATADLTGVDALADGEPLYPGTAASLVPVVLFLTGAPPPPVGADLAATAHPPESQHDSVTLGSVTLGPLRFDGPGATADAVIGDHAVAQAQNTGISGIGIGTGLPLTGTRTTATTRAPKPGSAGEATAEAVADLGVVKVVARSRLFPTSKAEVVVVQPDGSTVPITADGVAVANGALRGTAETTPSSARAGATFEHPGPNGGIVRITLVSTSVDAVGALVVPAVPVVAALGPLSSGGPVDDSAGRLTPVPGGLTAESIAPFLTPGVALTDGRPVIRAAARPASLVRRRGWLLGPLFLAWLCAGSAVLAAGRRMLAPQVEAHERRMRAAQAAASDHLDRD